MLPILNTMNDSVSRCTDPVTSSCPVGISSMAKMTRPDILQYHYISSGLVILFPQHDRKIMP